MTRTVYATFFVQDRYLGVPVDRVREVLRSQPVTRVPLAHPHVEGLLDLRGQIVTALDMRGRLGLPARDPHGSSANVIVTTRDGVVSLVVDRLGDVIAVDDAWFEPPPDTLQVATRRSIKGAYKLDDALLLDLDLDETVDITTDGGTHG
jgi:purine-binding chemotaxis protein CheW